MVWAIDDLEYHKLHTFDDRQWSVREASAFHSSGGKPLELIRMRDGAVACAWRSGKEKIAITRHLGEASEVWAEWEPETPNFGLRGHLTVDSRNHLWVIGRGTREIVRIGPKGSPLFTYRIESEQTRTPGRVMESSRWSPLFAVEDGRGRVWIWSDATPEPSSIRLKGFLVFDGDRAERWEPSGPRGSAYSYLALKDKTHLWLGVRDEGLYALDIDTLQARLVTPPLKEAFQRVESVYSQGEDLYVIATGSGPKSALWRRRGERWEQMAESLDLGGHLDSRWFSTEYGVLVCSALSNWYIGNHTPAASLYWRSGFPVEGSSAMIHRPDGRWFAIGREGESFHGLLTLPPVERSRVFPVEIKRDWVCDKQGRFWSIVEDKGTAVLREWNKEPRDHPLPEKLDVRWVERIIADEAGRIWLLPDRNEYSVASFDPDQGRWRVFAWLEGAWEEMRNDPPRFLRPTSWVALPQYSKTGGRIAFQTGKSELAFFDGKSWVRWKRKDIVPGEEADKFMIGVPYFDTDDQLCVRIDDTSMRYDGQGGWHKTTRDDSPASKIPPWLEPPGIGADGSEVVDNLGAAWQLQGKSLYRIQDGVRVEILAEDEPTPFVVRRKLREVWVDRNGGVFLRATLCHPPYFSRRQSTGDGFYLAPGTVSPPTQREITAIKNETAEFKISANPEW